MPSRSYAIVPLVAMGFTAVTSAGVTFTAADIAGLAIAAGGLAAIAYMEITAPDGSAIAIPVAAPVVPAPDAAPTVLPTTNGLCRPSIGTTSTVQAACSYVLNLDYANHPNGRYLGTVTSTGDPLPAACNPSANIGTCFYETHYVDGSGSTNNTYTIYSSTTSNLGSLTCSQSPGYVLVGSNCVLSDARVAVDDNRQDYFFDNSLGYRPYPGDQIGTIEGIQGTTNASGDTISFIGSNNGKPSSVSVVAQPGGGVLITQSTQEQDAAGTSYVRNNSITFDASGAIGGNSGYSNSGSLDTNTITPAGGATVVEAPPGAISANPTSPAESSPIVFPSDYARQGEAAAAAVPITTKLDTLHGDLSNTIATIDPVLPVAGDMPGWGNTFTNLLSWQLPAHTSTCPTPELDLSGVLGSGNTYVMNSHCALVQDNFAAFNAAMTVVWSMLALFIVLRA